MTNTPANIRPVENRVIASPPLRFAVLALGWVMFGVGVISVPVPLFPSTVFLLAAMWAFSLSSPRFRAWIVKRRSSRRARHQRRAIHRYGMVLAIATMIASLAFIALVVAQSWMAPVAVAVVLIPVAWHILSRPKNRTE